MDYVFKSSTFVKQECPLDDDEIDVIPESYHYSNHCLCFMCVCGLVVVVALQACSSCCL